MVRKNGKHLDLIHKKEGSGISLYLIYLIIQFDKSLSSTICQECGILIFPKSGLKLFMAPMEKMD
jgi:hypothetical protein